MFGGWLTDLRITNENYAASSLNAISCSALANGPSRVLLQDFFSASVEVVEYNVGSTTTLQTISNNFASMDISNNGEWFVGVNNSNDTLYLYQWDGSNYIQRDTIVLSDTPLDVAIDGSGDTIVVGMPSFGSPTTTGKVELYNNLKGGSPGYISFDQSLPFPPPIMGNPTTGFGRSLDISDDGLTISTVADQSFNIFVKTGSPLSWQLDAVVGNIVVTGFSNPLIRLSPSGKDFAFIDRDFSTDISYIRIFRKFANWSQTHIYYDTDMMGVDFLKSDSLLTEYDRCLLMISDNGIERIVMFENKGNNEWEIVFEDFINDLNPVIPGSGKIVHANLNNYFAGTTYYYLSSERTY